MLPLLLNAKHVSVQMLSANTASHKMILQAQIPGISSARTALKLLRMVTMCKRVLLLSLFLQALMLKAVVHVKIPVISLMFLACNAYNANPADYIGCKCTTGPWACTECLSGYILFVQANTNRICIPHGGS